MKELNIGTAIVNKRREKGITQDELAEYIGVSKASVSKWETGQSYPDITFIPQLAAYFNMSIDDLIGYSPQMTKEDIQKLYHKLASRFANAPFEDALAECRAVIRKYYSCFPLLLQMAILFINHHMLAKNDKEKEAILREAAGLCARVKTESGDVRLSKEAISMQALCCLALKEPQAVLDMVGETIRPTTEDDALIAQAYQLMGNAGKAKEITQISLYVHLIASFSAMVNYLQLCVDDLEKGEEIINRALLFADIYHMEKLNPNLVSLLYISGAHMYLVSGNSEKAMDMLERYVDVCVRNFFPYQLRGDSFFDSIDSWLSDLDLGSTAPRSEKLIKESMMHDVLMNPVFASLSKEPRYQSITQKLKGFIEGK